MKTDFSFITCFFQNHGRVSTFRQKQWKEYLLILSDDYKGSTRIRYVSPDLSEKEDFDRTMMNRNRLVIKNVADYKNIKCLIKYIKNNKYETLFNLQEIITSQIVLSIEVGVVWWGGSRLKRVQVRYAEDVLDRLYLRCQQINTGNG